MNAPEQRFLCPHCGQKLACEAGYDGWQIQCPACQGTISVPTRAIAVQAAPPASPASGSKPASGPLRLGQSLKFGLRTLAAAAAGAGVTAGLTYGPCKSSVRIAGVRVWTAEMGDVEAIVFGVLVFLALLFSMMDSVSD